MQNRASQKITAYRRKKRIVTIAVILVLLVLALIGTILVTKVYTLENIRITGNVLYDAKQLEERILSDKYSNSTIYMYLKYRFAGNNLDIPFVDSVDVSMEPDDPHTINMKVYEKKTLGYLYIPAIDQNAYFDRDGYVIETSDREISGVPKVSGLKCDSVVLYERLNFDDPTALNNLLQLTQLFEKYDIKCKDIEYNPNSKTMKIHIKKIEVLLGTANYLPQKILRLSYILPQLKGKKGVLHVNGWTPETTDIVFRPQK